MDKPFNTASKPAASWDAIIENGLHFLVPVQKILSLLTTFIYICRVTNTQVSTLKIPILETT